MSVPDYLEAYLARGWPLLPVTPRSKKPPLTPHGVLDATTDRDLIADWLRRWPQANWAVACGSPGPQVLDLDYPDRAPAAVLAAAGKVPGVATHRTPHSGHAYFEGTEAGTVNLGYGELRGRGHYAMVPPSTHPCGEPYRWVRELRGPPLPVPVSIAAGGHRAGTGEHRAPVERVPYGERHDYLKDFAVHMLRGGFLDRQLIERHLRHEFEDACELLPPPKRLEFRDLADWAVNGSRIAARERDLAELEEQIRAYREEGK